MCAWACERLYTWITAWRGAGGWLSEWLVHAPLVVQARARTPSVLPFALVSVDRPVRAPQDRDATQVQIVGRLSRALGSFSRGASW